jgi:hypothetical protein
MCPRHQGGHDYYCNIYRWRQLIDELSPSIHKFDDEFTDSGLSAIRQAHRPEFIEGLSEH